MHKKRFAMTNGSLLDIDAISQINFRLNPSKYLWMGKLNLFNLSLPSMCKVLIGPDDSYTFLLSISTGSNIKRVFLTSSFAMLLPYLREINLLMTYMRPLKGIPVVYNSVVDYMQMTRIENKQPGRISLTTRPVILRNPTEQFDFCFGIYYKYPAGQKNIWPDC